MFHQLEMDILTSSYLNDKSGTAELEDFFAKVTEREPGKLEFLQCNKLNMKAV
jgi:hypothetical protein